jgi:hypothetical protein
VDGGRHGQVFAIVGDNELRHFLLIGQKPSLALAQALGQWHLHQLLIVSFHVQVNRRVGKGGKDIFERGNWGRAEAGAVRKNFRKAAVSHPAQRLRGSRFTCCSSVTTCPAPRICGAAFRRV